MLTGANAKKVRLTGEETAILGSCTVRPASGSRETLLQEVWGYNSGVTTHRWRRTSTGLRQRSKGRRKSEILVRKPVATSWCRDRFGTVNRLDNTSRALALHVD